MFAILLRKWMGSYVKLLTRLGLLPGSVHTSLVFRKWAQALPTTELLRSLGGMRELEGMGCHGDIFFQRGASTASSKRGQLDKAHPLK